MIHSLTWIFNFYASILIGIKNTRRMVRYGRKKDNISEQYALFKYSLIIPAVNNTFVEKSIRSYFVNVSLKLHTFPDGSQKYIAVGTLKRWYYEYSKFGFNALKPGTRIDNGVFKYISIDVLKTIEELLEKRKKLTRKALYEELIELGEFKKCEVSLSTFYRFLQIHKLEDLEKTKAECVAFEAEFANDIWQADTSNVMKIKVDGKPQTVYLIHIIDDASRLIVGQTLSFHDNAIVFQNTLKKAVKTYGVPKVLYVDNGSPYSNEQLSLICANMGINLIHATPYRPCRKR